MFSNSNSNGFQLVTDPLPTNLSQFQKLELMELELELELKLELVLKWKSEWILEVKQRLVLERTEA